jgi:hypothetical protein
VLRERQDIVAKSSYQQRHHRQKDHDRAVHGPELVVELGQHDPAGGIVLTKESTDHRHRLAREGELPTHDQHQRKTEQEKEQGGKTVLDADDLVVLGEDVLSPEGLFVMLLDNTHPRLLLR